MIQELFQLYADRWQFFLKLTLQHLEISLIAIVAALCIGLSLGILISSYRRSSSLVLGLTNFMYTIPSIALFGFLIPFSGIGDTTAIFALTVYAPDGPQHLYRYHRHRPGDHRSRPRDGKYPVSDSL